MEEKSHPQSFTSTKSSIEKNFSIYKDKSFLANASRNPLAYLVVLNGLIVVCMFLGNNKLHHV